MTTRKTARSTEPFFMLASEDLRARFAKFSCLCLAVLALMVVNVSANAADTIHIKKGAVLDVWGDSLTYGARKKTVVTDKNGAPKDYFPRSATPWPETLTKALGNGITLRSNGIGGATSADILSKYKKEKSDIVLVMIGTNDMLRFFSKKDETFGVEAYRANVGKIIDATQGVTGRVVLLVPPPVENPALDKILDPYRKALIEVGTARKVTVLDTRPYLAGAGAYWDDGLHLVDEGYRLIGVGARQAFTVD